MTKKKEVFNKKELIGEKVHCAIFGNGVIVAIAVTDDISLCKCRVEFGEAGTVINSRRYWYTDNGCNNTIPFSNPTLSFGHKEDFEFDYGVPSIDKKPFVLKDWLGEKGVDTRVFWENCKKKYNGFGHKRRELIKLDSKWWIDRAFSWDETLLDLDTLDLAILNDDWIRQVNLAKKNGYKIELGFGGK